MTGDFRDWIGRSLTREDVAAPRLLAEFRATLHPFLFADAHTACPPGFHLCLAPAIPLPEDTGPDGAERKGLFLPPIPLSRRMWAGGAIETLRPLSAGAAVTRRSVISDIRLKQGTTGPLWLVSIQHEISDAQGLALRERQDLVFRDAASAALAGGGPAQVLAADWIIEASPLLLFRFSAVTFNGHRIHYDHGYAAEEGYPGPLVHGPLQAVLMLNLASVRRGAVPRRFDYRCLAPLPGGGRFGVASDADATVLRVLRSDGVVTAEALASGDDAG
jgi:3-methylfumaryl-CoA hydratase